MYLAHRKITLQTGKNISHKNLRPFLSFTTNHKTISTTPMGRTGMFNFIRTKFIENRVTIYYCMSISCIDWKSSFLLILPSTLCCSNLMLYLKCMCRTLDTRDMSKSVRHLNTSLIDDLFNCMLTH